jgi:hypothetical protein
MRVKIYRRKSDGTYVKVETGTVCKQVRLRNLAHTNVAFLYLCKYKRDNYVKQYLLFLLWRSYLTESCYLTTASSGSLE